MSAKTDPAGYDSVKLSAKTYLSALYKTVGSTKMCRIKRINPYLIIEGISKYTTSLIQNLSYYFEHTQMHSHYHSVCDVHMGYPYTGVMGI